MQVSNPPPRWPMTRTRFIALFIAVSICFVGLRSRGRDSKSKSAEQCRQHRDLAQYLDVVRPARQAAIDGLFESAEANNADPGAAFYKSLVQEFLPQEPMRDRRDSRGATCNVKSVGFGSNNSAPSTTPGIHQFDQRPSCRWHRLIRCSASSAQQTLEVNASRNSRKDAALEDSKQKNETATSKEEKDQEKKEEKQAGKKGRALVLYMMHNTSDAASTLDRPMEWDNFHFFLEHGLMDATESTILFDRVDFIFVRINPDVKEAVEVASIADFSSERGSRCRGRKSTRTIRDSVLNNVRFFWVPSVACDLCAHWYVMNAIGLGGGVNTAQQKSATFAPLTYAPPSKPVPLGHGADRVLVDYKTVVFMNSGVRGPFVNGVHLAGHQQTARSWAPSWIDQVSMGDDTQTKSHFGRAVFGKFDASSFATLTVTSISRMIKLHAQSFFMVVPKSLLRLFHQLQSRGCDSVVPGRTGRKAKSDCIDAVEVESLDGLHVARQDDPAKRFKRLPEFRFYALSFNYSYLYPQIPKHEILLHEWMDSLTMPMGQRGLRKAPPRGAPETQGVPPKLWASLAKENPTLYHVDPCKAIFLKFGGDVFPRIPDSTLNAVYHLTAAQQSPIPLSRWSHRSGFSEKRRVRTLAALVRRMEAYKKSAFREIASKWLGS